MKFFSNYRRHFLVALHDTIMAGASFILALYLRLGDDFTFTKPILLATLLCPLVCLAVFSYMQLYRGLWRYASTRDLVVIGKSAVSAILLFYLAIFLINRLDFIPRSAPFIQLLLLLALLGTPRFLYRIWRDKHLGISTGLVG
ncbi:MAG: polysaccharide biosynthesis protein, partial [Pseudomonadota bacterium]